MSSPPHQSRQTRSIESAPFTRIAPDSAIVVPDGDDVGWGNFLKHRPITVLGDRDASLVDVQPEPHFGSRGILWHITDLPVAGIGQDRTQQNKQGEHSYAHRSLRLYPKCAKSRRKRSGGHVGFSRVEAVFDASLCEDLVLFETFVMEARLTSPQPGHPSDDPIRRGRRRSPRDRR